jgi:hypothetical protein
MSPRNARSLPSLVPAWSPRGAIVVVGVLLLGACGGGGGGDVPPGRSPGDAALKASQPGELLAFVKTKLQQRVATPTPSFGGVLAAAPPPATAAAADSRARSETLVQEQGVDEGDLVKTDGATLYTLHPGPTAGGVPAMGQLTTYRRAADGSLSPAGSMVLPPPADNAGLASGMYHAAAARRLAVLSMAWKTTPLPGCVGPCADLSLVPPQWVSNSTLLDMVSVADPAAPALAHSVSIEGRLMDSRVIDNTLYLVTVHAPRLAVEALPPDATAAQRAAALDQLAIGDVLPKLRVDGGPAQPLVADTDCYLQPSNASLALEITTVTAFDLASPALPRASRCFVGGSEALYMSPGSLYLATTRHAYGPAGERISYPPQIRTDLHKFALDAMAVTYRASGEVAGHLGWDAQRKSYRLSEHNGDLRVLTFTGERGWFFIADADSPSAPPPSPATLTVLREDGAALRTVGALPNAQRSEAIGKPGEQVYGVRFIGDRGYVVTFRQVDPLYVLDLANPADPRVVGELVMPGFSDHLFPLPQGLLLGIGRDATPTGLVGGVKVALIDVADPARATVLDTRVYGERGSASGLDHSRHGASLLQQGAVTRVGLPLALMRADGTELQQGLVRLEVDASTRTLADKPLLPSAPAGTWGEPWNDRSAQIGDQVYYFSRGSLTGFDW